MKLYLQILLSLLFFHAPLLAYEYNYNYESKSCLNESGRSGYNSGMVVECGKLVDSGRFGRHLRESDYRIFPGLRLEQIKLEDAKAARINLIGSQFFEVEIFDSNFSHAQLRDAVFNGSSLKRVNLLHADLRGTRFMNLKEWRDVNIEGASIDELTELPITCEEARAQQLVWKGTGPWPCDLVTTSIVDLPADLAAKNPGAFAIQEGDKLKVFPGVAAQLSPLPVTKVEPMEFGLNDWDYFEILCAARIESCLRSREGPASMYKLSKIPVPVLKKGIEFYHGKMDNPKSPVRFVGFVEVRLQNKDPEAFLARSIESLKANPATTMSSDVLDRTRAASLTLDFVPPDNQQTSCRIWSDPESSKKRIKCRIIIDFPNGLPEVGEQALKQVMNGLIRNAALSTSSLRLKLDKSIAMEYLIPVPIDNINFWQIEWGHYYSKPTND